MLFLLQFLYYRYLLHPDWVGTYLFHFASDLFFCLDLYYENTESSLANFSFMKKFLGFPNIF